ncbi:hypothetical protein HOG16_03360 [Candidatus Woesearchaeota archaeon]|jgi:hypothetical protein|nr:hypothetical protein [Candidatus Woesearchaeota archaeon]MBT4321563.1 hypothetical protein [Candidatus Woesearchaeota archaeon]MBT4631126.1 hypothetical protein [Candidatus Woesearchaeota archaeon]
MSEELIKKVQKLHDERYSHPDKVGLAPYFSKLAIEGRFHSDTPIPEKRIEENSLGLLFYEGLTEN